MNNTVEVMIHKDSGFTLVEMLVTLAVAAILIVGIGSIVLGALDLWDSRETRQELLDQANFAMDRITKAITRTNHLLVPLADNPGTGYNESLHNVLAVTLDPSLDRDTDGFADADNDKDGGVDEDLPADNTNDGVSGIVGVDDDNDGTIDEVSQLNNDEDTQPSDDWINGVDDDGDGSIDEDIPRINNSNASGAGPAYDNDGDGLNNEDWFDPVVYFVSADGKTLIERLPDVNPVDGNDYTERPIAEADNVTFTVDRLAANPGDRAILLNITLQLTDNGGETVNLQSQVRVGGGR